MIQETKMSVRLPIQRLCNAGHHGLIVACGRSIALLTLSDGALSARTQEIDDHTDTVKLLLVNRDHSLLITVAEDKRLKQWELPSLKLRGTRTLAKRATVVSFSRDEKHLLLADKFGDVYQYSMQDLNDTSALTSDIRVSPLLGHVSLLTAMYLTTDGQRIITADRDEHIRVSRYPDSWDIVAFLGGHRRFIGALLAVNDDRQLLSAGGERDLYVWDLQVYKLLRRLHLPHVLSASCQIAPPTTNWRLKNHTTQSKSGAGATNGLATQADDEEVETSIAVNKMVCLGGGDEGVLILSAAGASCLLTILIKDLESQTAHFQHFDLKQPVMDMIVIEDRLLVTVDRSRGPDAHLAPRLRILHWAHSKLQFASDEASAVPDAVYTYGDQSQAPSDETLYGELSLLVKEPAESVGYREDGQRPAKKTKST